MPVAEFDRSLAKKLMLEGGFVNDPDDPGGATDKGVTQAVYDTFRKSVGAGRQSVRLISDDEVRAIYKSRYWDLIKGDQLPPGVGFVVLDGGVNSGPGQSVKWLQRALGLSAEIEHKRLAAKAAIDAANTPETVTVAAAAIWSD